MPGPLVEATAAVTCPHGGKVTPQRTSARVSIGGAPATTSAGPWSVACPLQPPATPCTLATFAPGALRVLIEGQPAILADTTGLCPPNGRVAIALTQARAVGQ
jgi:hypothetical protein